MEIPLNKMYKSCEVCNCGDCRTGNYRDGSWFCPALQKQICDICCWYDSKDVEGIDLSTKCKSLRCNYYKEEIKW